MIMKAEKYNLSTQWSSICSFARADCMLKRYFYGSAAMTATSFPVIVLLE